MSFPVDRQVFINFLLKAKRQTYAAGDEAKEVTALLPGSKQLEYREGPLLYRDVYFGGDYFAGQETVYYKDKPIWTMTYAGGITDDAVETGPIYGFLQQALKHITPARPYRGPNSFNQEEYAYQDESLGDLENFWGEETISYQGQIVYHLHYSGGWLDK